jgi:adenylate kinase family enzyme
VHYRRSTVSSVALLGANDQLPAAPRRVLVAGTSGSGKTTLARQIAAVLDIPHVEIDALYHGPGWTPRPSFASDVAELVAQPAWVTEWQYGQVRPLLAAQADILVWLDLSRVRVMWQVIRRTVRRRRRGELLWNGNVEPPMWTFFTDADHIVRWAWRTHQTTAARMNAVLEQRPELPVVRLTSHAAARAWLTGPLAVAHRRPVA